MKRAIILLLISLIFSINVFASKLSEFNELRDNIDKLHKNFYNTTEKATCDEIFTNLSKDIESTDDGEYYFTLSSYLALSNDSHTSLYAPNLALSFKYFALQLNFIEDEVYVVSGISELSDYMAKQVIGINGYSIDKILKKATKVVPHDNEVYLKLWLNNQLNNTSFLSFIGIMDDQNEDVTLTFSDNSTLTLTPMMILELRSHSLISAVKGYSKYIYQGYYLAQNIDNKTLLISYNTCSEDPNYPIKNFINDVKTMLKKTKYEKIIVDLRYNGGGNSALFEPVIKLLKKQKCEKYCLIGEQTFSSAILNAVSLKDDASFILVGSPTGGSINHYGEVKSFILSESNWEVYYSTKYFKLSNKYEGSIKPDVQIKKDITSFIEGRDLEIEYCLK